MSKVEEIKWMLQAAQQLADSTDQRTAIYIGIEGHLNYGILSKLEQYERVIEVVSPQSSEVWDLVL